MVDFVGESSYSVAGGLEVVEISSSNMHSLGMRVCNGCVCIGDCGGNFCLVT